MMEYSYNSNLVLNILEQIEQALSKIKERTIKIQSADDFLRNNANMEKLDAVCMQFIAVGESLKGIEKITNKELLSGYPEIEWKKIMGFRDIIAHHYFDIDAEEIYWILDNELNPLINTIRRIRCDLTISVGKAAE